MESIMSLIAIPLGVLFLVLFFAVLDQRKKKETLAEERNHLFNQNEEVKKEQKDLQRVFLRTKEENTKLAEVERKNKLQIVRLKKDLKKQSTISHQELPSEEMIKWQKECENYKIQCDALTSQLKELSLEEKNRKEATEKKWQAMVDKLEEKISLNQKDLHSKQRSLRNKETQIKELLGKQEQLITRLKKIDPKELLVLKKRLKSHIHLYHVVKSQKQILEDRNKNFEILISLLCKWITQTSTKETIKEPASLGDLIEQTISITGLHKEMDTEFDKLEDQLDETTNILIRHQMKNTSEISPTIN